MKTSAAMALIATGAILAFAVSAHLQYFSFQVAGWVLLLTGVAGLVAPRRARARLRRSVVRHPPGEGGRLPGGWLPRAAMARRPGPGITPDAGEAASVPGLAEPAEETVEEIYEE